MRKIGSTCTTLDVGYFRLFPLLVYFSVSLSRVLRLPLARCICFSLGQWSQIDTPHVREDLMTRRGPLLGTRFCFHFVIRTSFTPFSPTPHTLVQRTIFSRTTFCFLSLLREYTDCNSTRLLSLRPYDARSVTRMPPVTLLRNPAEQVPADVKWRRSCRA